MSVGSQSQNLANEQRQWNSPRVIPLYPETLHLTTAESRDLSG